MKGGKKQANKPKKNGEQSNEIRAELFFLTKSVHRDEYGFVYASAGHFLGRVCAHLKIAKLRGNITSIEEISFSTTRFTLCFFRS